MVNQILELQYLGELLKRVMLFTCEWYDPTHSGGTRKHNHYKIMEINNTKRYENLINLLSLKIQDKFITSHTLESANLTEQW